MLGSNSPRMLGIGLPVVDSWNVWWSIYDNSVERFARGQGRGRRGRRREGGSVEATAAVLVTLPGGRGRLMGEHYDAEVTTVTPDDLGRPRARASRHAGATHLQLVLDPITAESIDVVGEVLADLDR